MNNLIHLFSYLYQGALSRHPFPYNHRRDLHTDHGGFALETWQLTTMARGALDARAFTHALTKYLSPTPRFCVVSVAEGLTGRHKARLGGLPCCRSTQQLKKLHTSYAPSDYSFSSELAAAKQNLHKDRNESASIRHSRTHKLISSDSLCCCLATHKEGSE